MANVTQGNYITAQASTDLSAKRYYIAILDTNGKAALAAAGTDAISGVLDDVPQGTTGLCSIKHISAAGTGKVIAGGSISKGDYLTSDGNGKAVATTTAANVVFGRARTAASTGDIFEFEHCFCFMHA